MKKLLILLIFFKLSIVESFSQTAYDYHGLGKIFKITVSNSMFPHTKRMSGHQYKEKIYPFHTHYSDSSVLIFIPDGFKKQKQTDFVIHFHGWWNNLDSVVAQFSLLEQFAKSGKNAILIIPQGPKNAPDSFGGKLEEKGVFSRMMSEISGFLLKEKLISNERIGKIILSGHSGAFRVISFILQRGGLENNIKEVFLFDAFYGQTEKYAHWVKEKNGKLIVIYTDDGGTKNETENFIDDLKDWNIKFFADEEEKINNKDLISNRIIFIHTSLDHNQVLYKNDNFYQYLISSCLK